MRKRLTIFVITVLAGISLGRSLWVRGDEKETCCGIQSQGIDKTEKYAYIFTCVGNELICPVMGTKFKADEKTVYSEYKGRLYAFCCPGCKTKFEKEAEKYTGESKESKSEDTKDPLKHKGHH